MKPILFNTGMVRAILDGRKTVTRRVVKPQPVWDSCDMAWSWKNVGWWRDGWNPIETITWKNTPCRPGDILYVRETWAAWSPTYGTAPEIIYKADGYSQSHKMKWSPSIHMPREAARVFLRVTDVRVERLQNITPEQAMKEGVIDPANRPYIQYEQVGQLNRYARNKVFPQLWDTTIKSADRALYGWDANPYVWVISFERISKEEALRCT